MTARPDEPPVLGSPEDERWVDASSLAWLVPVLIALALTAGRATGRDSASASASARVYAGPQGDVFRVPVSSHALHVTSEAGSPRFYCSRIGLRTPNAANLKRTPSGAAGDR
jgi:hypothetical protein